MNDILTEKQYQVELLGFLNDPQPDTIEEYKKSLIFEYGDGEERGVIG